MNPHQILKKLLSHLLIILILFDYPWILQHAGSPNDQVKDSAEGCHDTDDHKADVPDGHVGVDHGTRLVKQLDDPTLWLLDMLEVKLWVNNLVPDDRDPGAGQQAQEDRVDEHECDPEDDMWPVNVLLSENRTL